MTIPIQKGRHIILTHKHVTGNYEMRAAESYNDYYGIGYTYCGDRLIHTPDKTIICNGKCLCFIHKNLRHKTSSILTITLRRYLKIFFISLLSHAYATILNILPRSRIAVFQARKHIIF